MKRIGLILLACLLLALPTVAQAPEKAAPDDLVVTAEIVGYGYEPKWLTKNSTETILYAKMIVRNTTNQPRQVWMMGCDWANSWIAKATGPDSLFTPTFLPACTANYPLFLTIPVGEGLIFSCPLLLVNGRFTDTKNPRLLVGFRVGFIDVKNEEGVLSMRGAKPLDKITNARAVYWSNLVTNAIDLTTAVKIKRGHYDFIIQKTDGRDAFPARHRP